MHDDDAVLVQVAVESAVGLLEQLPPGVGGHEEAGLGAPVVMGDDDIGMQVLDNQLHVVQAVLADGIDQVLHILGLFQHIGQSVLRWDESLRAGEASIAGIKQLFERSRPLLQGALVLADNHFNHLTSAADFEEDILIVRKDSNGSTPNYVVDDILTDPDYIRQRNSREIFEYPIHNRTGTVPALLCNLFRTDETEYSARVMYIPDDHVFTPARRFLLHHLCCPGLIRLMEYDAAHGTEYTAALRTFVEEKYSVTHTADKLFVHRTMLLKHLKKIDDITNLDLDDWNTRLHLALSFQFLAG